MIRSVFHWACPKWVAVILATAASSLWCGELNAAQASKLMLKVTDPNRLAGLVADGGRLVQDYGSFQLVEVDAAAEVGSLSDVRILKDARTIKLNARSIDTSSDEARAQAANPSLASVSGKTLQLVQFVGPIKPEWAEQLRQTGAQIVAYVPNNAYLIYGGQAALSSVRTMSAGTASGSAPIVWQGAFLDSDKLQGGALLRKKGVAGLPADQTYVVQMVADDEANSTTAAVIDQFRIGALVSDQNALHYRNITVRLSPEGVAAVASRPEVVSIMPHVAPHLMDERQDLIISGNVEIMGTGSPEKLVPLQTSYMEWLRSKGFNPETPSSFVVDVTDSGIDDGTNTHNHIGLRIAGGPTNASRVVYNRLFGSETNEDSTIAGCDGHGNINAHIIAGYIAMTVTEVVDATDTNIVTFVTNYVGQPYQDAQGYYYGLGVAPFVRVGSSVIFEPDYTFPDFRQLLDHAYEKGARISANSWGADVGGLYTANSQIYDSLVRDARQWTNNPPAGNQQMTIVFAAGNAGPSSGSVGSPATAKNVITVGASENVHPFAGGDSRDGADGSGITDRDADNANEIAYFSSRGPTTDGRHKPDLVAPGTHITGGAPQQETGDENEVTEVLECFDGTGVSGGVDGNMFFPARQTLYTASSGTSQATPSVAGAAALFRSYYQRKNNNLAPSPALIKAYLMNSARYLTAGMDDLWSNNQGMGLVDLGRGFDDVPRLMRDQETADLFSSVGGTRVFAGNISDTNQEVRITLAWTDAPGSTFGASYNNNLDLIVYVNGVRYYGNSFSGAYSVPSEEPDEINNVESVFLPAGTQGEIAVVVVGADINSDGVPGGAPLDQDFALVVYNFKEGPVSVPVAVRAEFAGETNGVFNGFVDPGETVTFRLGLRNGGTANTTDLMATLLESASITPVTTEAVSYGVLETNGPTVFRDYTFIVNEDVECGSKIEVQLDLTDMGVPKGKASFMIQVGYVVDASLSASNPQRIVIRDVQAAVPYPSTNLVGFPLSAGGRMTVTLNGFGHTFPADVTAILASPSGKALLLLNNNSFTVSGSSTITFDDTASTVASGGLPANARVRPDGSPGFLFTGIQIPAGTPTNFVARLSDLAADGLEGKWSLYVFDSFGQDSGAISNGWTINAIGQRAFCNVTVADVAVSMTATPNRVVLGDNIVYTITMTNRGPNNATNVVLVENLSPALGLVKTGQSQGTVAITNNQLTFKMGTIPTNGSASVSITAQSILQADIATTSSVLVLGDVDPIPENNFASVGTLRGKSGVNGGAISFANDGPAPATVYPATIQVSGVTGIVSRIDVRLSNLSHGYPRDLEVLLVGPFGQKVILMSDCGPGSGVYNVDLAFSDFAGTTIQQAPFFSGSYRPTDNNTLNTFLAAPAPAGPYTNALSVFNAINPNGTWSLYVYDKQRGGAGQIAGGWGLDITLGNGVNNDLALGQSLPANVLRDRPFTIGLSVTNLGPGTASAVYVTNVVSPKLAVSSVTADTGSAEILGSSVVWTLGSMTNKAVGKLTINATPVALGIITNGAAIGTPDGDPVKANNVSVKTTVSSLPPGVTESPDPITIPTFGAASVYPSTIMVSNLTESVQKVTVAINRLSHTFPKDLDILLVGPKGQKVMLMSDSGISPVNGISLVFDDTADSGLPRGFIQPGTFKPTNFDTSNDALAAPAPAGPYQSGLATFVGTDGNGAWKLFVYDHATGDGGAIEGGWILNISTAVDSPTLKISKSGSNVVLAWPNSATGFLLQGAAGLGGTTSWTTITNPLSVQIGAENVVTNSATNNMMFFRLVR